MEKPYIQFQYEGAKQARKIFGKVLQSKQLRGTKNRKKYIIFSSERGNFFGKFLQSKSLKGIKKNKNRAIKQQ